jgi:hypothetical protein
VISLKGVFEKRNEKEVLKEFLEINRPIWIPEFYPVASANRV